MKSLRTTTCRVMGEQPEAWARHHALQQWQHIHRSLGEGPEAGAGVHAVGGWGGIHRPMGCRLAEWHRPACLDPGCLSRSLTHQQSRLLPHAQQVISMLVMLMDSCVHKPSIVWCLCTWRNTCINSCCALVASAATSQPDMVTARGALPLISTAIHAGLQAIVDGTSHEPQS